MAPRRLAPSPRYFATQYALRQTNSKPNAAGSRPARKKHSAQIDRLPFGFDIGGQSTHFAPCCQGPKCHFQTYWIPVSVEDQDEKSHSKTPAGSRRRKEAEASECLWTITG